MTPARAKAETFEDVRGTLGMLTNKFVEKYGESFGTRDDVFQELTLVFEECYRKWDHERGTAFDTYLHYKCGHRLRDIVRRGPLRIWKGGPNEPHALERWQSATAHGELPEKVR